MVHEVPDQKSLFAELVSILKPEGKILMVEPPLHVSRRAFEKTLETAADEGLKVESRPRMLFSKAAVLQHIKAAQTAAPRL